MPSNDNGLLSGSNGSQENGGQGWGPQMPIAVIGMSCRFPQEAENPEKLWDMLVNSRSACTEFPAHKSNMAGHYHPDPTRAGTSSVRHANFLKDNGRSFDAPFFSISKTEALTMDPQQRMLMESVYEAIENAGMSVETVTGSNTSCFVGAFTSDFQSVLLTDCEMPHKYAPTGNSASILSNRVSWFYDLRGCSLTLDTACSSSLVATHLACQNLKDGSSEMSIVGGVNFIEHPQPFFDMTTLGFLSPDGRCHSFDHRANGYARGEGAGTVILKPLEAAIRDGNTIRAVIRNTGLNQDGRTPGMTLPSEQAQERLIRSVYKSAGLDLALTSYVEAHGTGTTVGDPKEAGAIGAAFSEARQGLTPIYIGAVKSNIGHLEGASGVAGIIKTVSVLERAVIPPNINFEKCNPTIPAEKWGIQFPLEPTPFPDVSVRRASINSFGFGGTNAHVVIDDTYNFLRIHGLKGVHRTVASSPRKEDIAIAKPVEEAPASNGETAAANGVETNGVNGHANGVETNGTSNGVNGHANGTSNGTGNGVSNGHASTTASDKVPKIFAISTYDDNGAKRTGEGLAEYLSTKTLQNEDEYLSDLAYTLAEKRSTFSWKAFAIAATKDELVQRLPKVGTTAVHSRKGGVAKAGFIFTGQGAQWYAMGKDLLVYPVFRASMEASDKYLKELGCPWSLLEELSKTQAESKVNIPTVSQAACTALQVALVDLLTSWGIKPARVIGHSSGEIAAAYCAGAFDQQSALKIAYFRGVVAEKLGGLNGSMMAVGAPQDALEPYLERVRKESPGELTIACFNSPKNITVSGDEKLIDRLHDLLEEDKVFNRKLAVKNAYHSGHMQTVAKEYKGLIGDIQAPAKNVMGVKLFSTVVSKEVPVSDLRQAQYWVDNMVSPVVFAPTLQAMCSASNEKSKLRVGRGTEAPVQFLIEVGPHPALQSAAKDTFAGDKSLAAIQYTYLIQRNKPAVEQALAAIGKLYTGGFAINLTSVNNAAVTTPQVASMLTDLPPYSFNHSQEYWPEGHMSKNFRFRKQPRHDLLGAPVLDWNSQDAKWKHVIRVSENPWVKDHKVTGRVVYPGVGYIVMAIEAARQLAEERDEKVSGFVLRDISIRAALTVPETEEGVEVSFALSPDKESSYGDSAIWKAFKISSFNPATDAWTEHCRGVIKVELESANVAVDDGREQAAEQEASAAKLKHSTETCTVPYDMPRSYSELCTIGLVFGPHFMNLGNVATSSTGTGEAAGTITIPNVREVMPKNFTHEHVIHPATMDSMLHTFLACMQPLSGEKKISEPMVPVAIKEIRVARDISNTPGATFRSHCLAEKSSHRRFQGTITAWDPETAKTKVSIKNIQFVPLQSAAVENRKRQVNFNVDWRPDFDLLNNSQVRTALEKRFKPQVFDRKWVEMMLQYHDLAAFIYNGRVLDNMEGIDEENLPFQLQRYLTWMRFQREQYKAGNLLYQTPEWPEVMASPERTVEILKKVKEASSVGAMISRIGEALPAIFRKEADALRLIFADDLIDAYYRDNHGTENIHQWLALYLDDYCLKNTNVRILEIGAGTGGTSWPALEAVAPKHLFPRVSKYTYTDVSPGFFEKAKAKFRAWSHVLEFVKFDVEKPPSEQNIEEGSYDILIAANVLHATVDLQNTLTNARKLLKPGGKLILQEVCQPKLLAGPFVFGTLPGWWLSVEEDRKLTPLMSEQGWDTCLKKNGFSGTDLVLKDDDDVYLHAQSLLITSNPISAPAISNDVLPTAIMSTEGLLPLAEELGHRLTRMGTTVQYLKGFEDLDNLDPKQTNFIILNELQAPVLANITEDQFPYLRTLLSKCGGLLWVTKSLLEDPTVGMATGLLRGVRWERDLGQNITLLSLDSTAGAAEHISSIYDFQFISQRGVPNSEYRVENDLVLTNRLVNADYLDEYLVARSGKIPAVPRAFGAEPRRALKLMTDSPGLLNTLQFVDDPLYDAPIEATDVEVEIKATGLNFRDIMCAMGEVKGELLGAEGAGIVSRVGPDVKNVKVGDRVTMLASKNPCFSTFSRTVDVAVTKISDEISFEQAAAIPVVGCTVVYCLNDVARLRKGESILVHAAAGGVGQGAIMLAQHIGAEVYATVSSDEKKKILMDTYGLPADHIFSSRDVSFAKGIMRQTGGKGVNVILNSLAGEFLRLSWQCIAPFGRFVEIGKRDIYSNSSLEMFPFRLNVSFCSVDLETVMALDPPTTGRLLEETVDYWRQGVFKNITPTTIEPFSKVEEVFRLMQSGKHLGKIVLTANKDDMVTTVPQAPPLYRFDKDASYVLAGGLGGLGRSQAHWLISRGARNIIFMSRSGANTDSIRDFIKELEAEGATVKAYACDVSDAQRLAEVLAECKATLPPIKGCINGAMQLRDSSFEMMTYEQYAAAVRPKVFGSWNLHEQLPKDMDFYIMLSSICGIIGNRGQSNYAAGNTYQDALAHYRVKNGLPATSLDLGTMLSVGFVAENAVNQADLTLEPIREDEFHAVLEHYVDRRNASSHTGLAAQAAIGLATKARFAQRGIPEPSFMLSPLFNLLRTSTEAAGGDGGEEDLSAMTAGLRAAKSLDEAAGIVLDAIVQKLAAVMSTPAEEIDTNKPIHFYGVDSLVAVELRNWLTKNMESSVEILDIMGDEGMNKLAEKVAKNSKLVNVDDK